jgi:hypothetical protein
MSFHPGSFLKPCNDETGCNSAPAKKSKEENTPFSHDTNWNFGKIKACD